MKLIAESKFVLVAGLLAMAACIAAGLVALIIGLVMLSQDVGWFPLIPIVILVLVGAPCAGCLLSDSR